MREHMERQIKERLRKKLVLLPDFAVDSLRLLEYSTQVGTRYEYAKDIVLFFEFIISSEKCSKVNIKDIEPDDLDELTENDMLDFFDFLSSHVRSYVTSKDNHVKQEFNNAEIGKSRKLATLRTLFAFMFKRKLLSKDIMPSIEITVPKKEKIKHRLTPDEMTRFFRTITDDLEIKNHRQEKFHEKVKFRDYIMALLLAYTGIRISELVQLDINDILVQKKALIVVRKGGNEQAITMPKQIMEDIRDFVQHRKKIEVPKPHQNALFISLHKRRIDVRTVRALLEKYRIRAEIEIKITPHVFRRTFGTNHYNTYADMYLTAKTLGHSSAETTRRFYADPDEERVSRSMEDFTYDKKPEQDSKKLMLWAKKLGVSVDELLEELGT